MDVETPAPGSSPASVSRDSGAGETGVLLDGSTSSSPELVRARLALDNPPLRRTGLNAIPVWAQWVLSVVIFGGIVGWLVTGNVAMCTRRASELHCPLDSWAAPLGVGALAYLSAYGFFALPCKQVISDVAPLLILGGFAVLFAWQRALLPFVIGCSSTSFMIILTVFNSGVTIEHEKNGRPVVDYSFTKYRGYVASMLVIGNGVMNALGFLGQQELDWTPIIRWVVTCFAGPVIMLIPALVNIVKGKDNGQYNVPDNATFFRLFISTRLGEAHVTFLSIAGPSHRTGDDH